LKRKDFQGLGFAIEEMLGPAMSRRLTHDLTYTGGGRRKGGEREERAQVHELAIFCREGKHIWIHEPGPSKSSIGQLSMMVCPA
jgi:hypothetical protein